MPTPMTNALTGVACVWAGSAPKQYIKLHRVWGYGVNQALERARVLMRPAPMQRFLSFLPCGIARLRNVSIVRAVLCPPAPD
eukprot:CAMPEP_0181254728 /NCGR_PEP_ID=MMETSP1096-20121128/48765_1 /TAXON_ID=156174 ORGANISM="Chrysochromulina ericina, Strain CCMP281" /NCGR_SAMPLE_ID=MMETSP1096 /ASSEMBLY_ACC=CAM_ASM_000453 /LENGTH=81 /DNA_ID=CAMNT_0023352797 /DNA_START=150 /DNA_END=395 /DNA_ORIENTATION=-